MPIQYGSCSLGELVQVAVGNPNPTDAAVYNSFMATTTKMPVFGQIISGGYKLFGIDPVGRPGVYACPADFETIYVDRRTSWDLEKRLAFIIAGILIINIALSLFSRK